MTKGDAIRARVAHHARKPRLRAVLGAALVLMAVAVVARQLKGDLRAVEGTFASAFHLDGRWLAAAWAVQTIGALLMLDTWRGIVEALGVRAGRAQHAQRYAYAALAHVVPGGVWAPLGRLAAYGRADALAVGAGMTVEWVLLGVAGLMLYGAALPWAAAAPPGGAWALVAAAALGLAVVHPAVFRRLIALAARLTGRGPAGAALPPVGARALGGWLARAVGVLLLSGLALYAFMRAVSPAPASALADAIGIGGLTVALGNLFGPLPLTGLLKDLGMVLLLQPVYGSSAVALGVVVAWRLWMIAVELSWALLATAWARRVRPSDPVGAA